MDRQIDRRTDRETEIDRQMWVVNKPTDGTSAVRARVDASGVRASSED